MKWERGWGRGPEALLANVWQFELLALSPTPLPQAGEGSKPSEASTYRGPTLGSHDTATSPFTNVWQAIR